MEYTKMLNNWWRVKGKLYLLYAILIYLGLSPFIKQIPIVEEHLPEDKYGIPMIAVCLWLMIQVFMGMFNGDAKEVALIKFEHIENEFKKRLKSAKTLDNVVHPNQYI